MFRWQTITVLLMCVLHTLANPDQNIMLNPQAMAAAPQPSSPINVGPPPEPQMPEQTPTNNAAVAAAQDFYKIAKGKLDANCKALSGLSFCTDRTYTAFVGKLTSPSAPIAPGGEGAEAAGGEGAAAGDPAAQDGKAQEKWDAAKPYFITKGLWCQLAYKKVLCAYFLPFCVTGTKKYEPCGQLCIDFCKACGVCGPISEIRGAQNFPGMDPDIIEYCTPFLRTGFINARECTDARTCGWLDVPPRMNPLACPVVNH